MGGNCGVACFVSHFDCLKGLRYRTDLVQFDQDGISAAKGDTFCQTLSIGYKQVVTDKLYFSAKLCGQLFPAFPVFFIQSILDGDDRIFLYQCFPVSDQLFGSKYSAGFGSLYSPLVPVFHSEEAASIAILKSLPGS